MWKSELQWPKQKSKQEIQDDDPRFRAEVKVHGTALHESIIEKLKSSISGWTIMKRVVASILKYRKILISRIRHQPSDFIAKALSPSDLDVSLYEYAQQEIIRLHQQQVFSEEIDHLRDGNTGNSRSLSRSSGIYIYIYILTAIWLPHGQIWAIIEGTASLTQC